MDSSFLFQILYMIVLLPAIIFLIFITLKFGGKYTGSMSKKRIIRVIERVQLNQHTMLSVVVINNKAYVVTNGDKGAQILLELDDEALANYNQNQGISYKQIFNGLDKNLINKLRGKVKNEKIQ